MNKEEYIDSVTELLILERVANFEFHVIEIDKSSSILTAGIFSFLGLIVINIKSVRDVFDSYVLYDLIGIGVVCLLTGMWVKHRSSLCKSFFLMHKSTKDLKLNKKDIKNHMSEEAYEYYKKHSSEIDIAREINKLGFPTFSYPFGGNQQKEKYERFEGAKILIRSYQLQKFLFYVQSFEVVILLTYVMFSLDI